MNVLEAYISDRLFSKLEMIEAMDLLQDQGIISDNCIWPADVDPDDAARAVKLLRIVFGHAGRQQQRSKI